MGHAVSQESPQEVQTGLMQQWRALVRSFSLFGSEVELLLWHEASALLLAHLPVPADPAPWAAPPSRVS
eukprot:CAMPEP_0202846518 /NCGR_PEP_ID=MMETSP1389-20130828/72996_1 /ASSEMBLY_ACC=CAM_ASM_000865 /TAXON_ID=302021 /ORGANISM="Rhodomonas sp., Strain CCMP768" /LENGTH=68 /DNA_ID=CAMNT_0049524095 /DNA_START=1 /DNA_END=204 /DNA_ORIENTATION=-